MQKPHVATFCTTLLEHLWVIRSLQHDPTIERAAELLASAIADGRRLLLCGNGGSAADAQHLAAEMVGRFMVDRRALPAIALTTDTSALTCIGNDYGFAHVFERQVQALGSPGDVLLALSTSGRSENVRLALTAARQQGMLTIGLLGGDGGPCAALCDVPIIVPSTSTARVQEAHGLIGHYLCEAVERAVTTGAATATGSAPSTTGA